MPQGIKNSLSRVAAFFDVALEDRRVTPTEASIVLTEMARDGVTQAEGHFARETFGAHRDEFEPAARDEFDRFYAGLAKRLIPDVEVGAERSLDGDPELPENDRWTVAYAGTRGEPVVDGVSASDAVQGAIGDCYLIAAMASIAHSHPEAIRRAIRNNGDGTFTVTLFERPQPRGRTRPVKVTVDGRLPQTWTSLAYAHSPEDSELWPALLEKAYAKWKGGYAAIDKGYPSAALGALTGGTPRSTYVFPDSDPEKVFDALKAEVKARKCITAMTCRYRKSEYAGTGLLPHHVYSVLDVAERDGQQLVRLRNPLGQFERGFDGRDDGDFWLPIEDFVEWFMQVDAVSVPRAGGGRP